MNEQHKISPSLYYFTGYTGREHKMNNGKILEHFYDIHKKIYGTHLTLCYSVLNKPS